MAGGRSKRGKKEGKDGVGSRFGALSVRKRRKWMKEGALTVWNKNYYITVRFE